MDFDEYYRRQHPNEFADPRHHWHPRHPVWVAHRHQIERAMLHALALIDRPVEELNVLEVGCGTGRHSRFLVEIGIPRARVHSIDLLDVRLAQARAMNPGLGLVRADATRLPWRSAVFDLVLQFTAFSSMLDHGDRQRAAAEMERVAGPGGWLLTYDVVVPQPNRIPDGLPVAEWRRLFPTMRWVQETKLHSRLLPRLASRPVVSGIVEALPLIRKSNVMLLGQFP